MKKVLTSALAVAMLAGCGTSSASNANQATQTNSSKSVSIASDTDINTMNSSIATDETSFSALDMCMAGLTKLNEDGTVAPDLAESWDVSDDGLTYTFHIQKDAKWSNGDDLTANDFVYGWNRLIDPDTASDYAFLIDKNADSNTINAKDWKAVDDKTFEVTLSAPCDYLLSLCSFASLFPLNEKYVEEQGDQYALSNDNMIYCGPYVMSSWTVGDSYTFTKNPDYWDQDGTKDIVDTVNFRLIQGQSAILDYEAGNLDYVKLSSEVIDDYASRDDIVNYLSGFAWYISMNMQNEYLSNKNVRQAIAYAIDTQSLCDSVLKDGSAPLTGIVSSKTGINADGKDYRDIAGSLVYPYDEDKAKDAYAKACKELGTDSISLDFLYEDSDVTKNVAAFVMNALEKAGFTLNAVCKPKKSRSEDMNNHDYDVAITRWGPDYSDPQTYMDIFTSTNASNSAQYNNPDFDAAVKKAETTDAADSEARWKDFATAEKILVQDDCAIVPLYQAGSTALQNKKLTGITHPPVGATNYNHMTLSE
mgnify:CR=1 FL=1